MVDAVHARAQGPLDALGAVGVAGYAHAQVAGGFHHGPDFFLCVLGPTAVLAQVEHATGAGNFNEVGAALELLTHGLAALVGAVG